MPPAPPCRITPQRGEDHDERHDGQPERHAVQWRHVHHFAEYVWRGDRQPERSGAVGPAERHDQGRGAQSYATAYASLVSFVGSTTNTYKSTSAAQQTLLQQTQTAQQSNSGVNLDEEAANLIKYQQLYQANSKVIQTASTLFSTILQIVN